MRKDRWEDRKGTLPSFRRLERDPGSGLLLPIVIEVGQAEKELLREELHRFDVRVRFRCQSPLASCGDVEVGSNSRLLRRERESGSLLWPGRTCLGPDRTPMDRRQNFGCWEEEQEVEARFEYAYQTLEEDCLVVLGVCLDDVEMEGLTEDLRCRRWEVSLDEVWRY